MMKRMAFFGLVILGFGSCSFEQEENHQVDKVRQTRKEAFLSSMKAKNFQLFSQGPCEDAMDDTIQGGSSVHIDTTMLNDMGRTVKFKFIQACCMEFLGDYSILNDTVVLKLEQVNEEVCECFCWYSYTLILGEPIENYSGIKIQVL